MIGVLHIGAEKTGTTTLQECFFLNRERMAAAGVLYPQTPGGKQHSLLAFYAMRDTRENLMTRRMPAEWTRDRAAWREGFGARFGAEVAARRASHLLVSTELLHSQVFAVEEVERLKALLDRWCEAYRVVFYMRRQDRAQASRYSTDLRTGGTPASPLEAKMSWRGMHDYERALMLWAGVFGTQSIVPRVFEAASARDGGLVADFVEAGGLPLDAATLVRPPRRNSALSRPAQQFLLGYNRTLAQLPPPADGGRLQRIVADAVEAICPGPSALPSRDEARAFYDRYRDGNARVAEQWFGGKPLFDEDFGDYPEHVDETPLDGAEAMAIATRLVRHLAGNALWLDAQRLEELLAARPAQLPRMLAGHLGERSPALAERVAALQPPPAPPAPPAPPPARQIADNPRPSAGRARMQDDSGLKRVLTLAWAYKLFQVMLGSRRGKQWLGDTFWRLQPGQKVVDIGCGPGNAIPYLPKGVRYVGFDISPEYIAHARARYAGDPDKVFVVGTAEDFLADLPAEMRDADLVMMNGLMHHLDDAQALTALRLARASLAPHGRLVSVESCFLLRQAPLSRWLVSRDRGRNVRFESEWKALVGRVFDRFETHILTGHIRIPYTLIVIEAQRS